MILKLIKMNDERFRNLSSKINIKIVTNFDYYKNSKSGRGLTCKIGKNSFKVSYSGNDNWINSPYYFDPKGGRPFPIEWRGWFLRFGQESVLLSYIGFPLIFYVFLAFALLDCLSPYNKNFGFILISIAFTFIFYYFTRKDYHFLKSFAEDLLNFK